MKWLNRAPSAAPSAAESPGQRRNSARFGGTFGGRKCQTETKVSFRGHLRQPNAASTRGVRRPKLPSAAEPGFCQTGRNLVQMNLLPPKTIDHAYFSTKTHIQVPRGLKHAYTPSTTLHSHTIKLHCSNIIKTHKLNICPNMHFYP